MSSRELWTFRTYQTSSGGGSSSSSARPRGLGRCGVASASSAPDGSASVAARGSGGPVGAGLGTSGRPPSGVCSSTSNAGEASGGEVSAVAGVSVESAVSPGRDRFAGLVGRMTHATPRGGRRPRTWSKRPTETRESSRPRRRSEAARTGAGVGLSRPSSRSSAAAELEDADDLEQVDQTSRPRTGRPPSGRPSSGRPWSPGRGRRGWSTRPCSSRLRWRSGTRRTAGTAPAGR